MQVWLAYDFSPGKNVNAAKTLTERKREDIIQAAKDEFRENGFAATSMDQIAETAKVSKRTVYNHFDSKEALFEAVALDLCHHFSRASDYPYLPDQPVREQLTAIATRQVDTLTNVPFLRSFKMILAESLATPGLRDPVSDDFQITEVGIMKWIEDATKAGKLHVPDTLLAGKQFLGLLETFTSMHYLYMDEIVTDDEEKKTIVDSTVAMFLDHYEVRD